MVSHDFKAVQLRKASVPEAAAAPAVDVTEQMELADTGLLLMSLN